MHHTPVDHTASLLCLQDTEDDPAAVYKDTTYPVISVRRVERQKRRCCVQLCLFAGMILGLSLCVLGSVFLYRNMYTVVSVQLSVYACGRV